MVGLKKLDQCLNRKRGKGFREDSQGAYHYVIGHKAATTRSLKDEEKK
jgi:hypothetical protein